MSNKSNLNAIRKLSQNLVAKGISDYKALESTIIQVLSNELGEQNELTKRARDIKHGYVVPSAFSHINGLTTDNQYNSEQYKMYIDLLNETENYLMQFEISDKSKKKIEVHEIYNLINQVTIMLGRLIQ